MIRVVEATATPYALRLARPLVSARGRTRYRRGWLLRVATKSVSGEDCIGWGDAASWPGFGCDPDTLAFALEAAAHALVGATVESVAEIDAQAAALRERGLVEVAHAVELALLDAFARAGGTALVALLPQANHAVDRIRYQALALGDEPGLATPPHPAWKLKVGGRPLADDEARVTALRARHPNARIRLDAGGSWTPDEAAAAIATLARHDIDWFEQPLARGQVDAWPRLRAEAHAHDTRVAADESCLHELEPLLAAEGVDALVIKPMYMGGLLPAARLALRGQALGLEICITSALESAVGRAGAVQLASTIDGTHGLGGIHVDDVARLHETPEHVSRPLRPGLGVVPRATVAADTSIPHPLIAAAAARPDAVAAVSAAGAVSYATLIDQVARAAGSLAARGVRCGDVVAYHGPADLDWLVGFHALGWLGAVIAPVREPADASDVDHVVASHSIAAGEHVPPEAWSLAAPRLLLATSGSTGTPQRVTLTTGQLYASASASALRLGHHLDDRWLCCLPLVHIGGASIVYRCAWGATTMVLHPKFDVAAVNAAIDAGDVTLISLVPAMLEQLLAARGGRPYPRSLRAVLLGGGPATDALLGRCRALSVPVARTWGMTEAGSQIATTVPGDERPGLPPLAVAEVLEREGRLRLRSPLAAPHSADTAGARASVELQTADRGKIRAGRVHVHGRADGVINSGGIKIDPERVAAALRQHPAIADAAVVALDHPLWGQRPAAACVLRDGSKRPDDTLLAEHCRDALPRHHAPDHFFWLAELPRTALGKLRREALRLELIAQLQPSPATTTVTAPQRAVRTEPTPDERRARS